MLSIPSFKSALSNQSQKYKYTTIGAEHVIIHLYKRAVNGRLITRARMNGGGGRRPTAGYTIFPQEKKTRPSFGAATFATMLHAPSR